MRKALFALAIAGAVPSVARAQTPQDQINAVYQAQQQEEARQRAAYDAQQAELRHERQEQLSVERARLAAAAALQKQRAEEVQADKQRNQKPYEDQLRELNLERQKTALEAEKARAARENDYINADLAHRSAETDVVKSEADRTRSEADANRNVSSGVKNYLDQSGLAEVKKSTAPSDATPSEGNKTVARGQ